MKMTNYFPHDSNFHNNLKVQALIEEEGWEGYGLYWAIVEIMRQQEGFRLPDKEFTYIALKRMLNIDLTLVQQFINKCITMFELFELKDGYIYDENLKEHFIEMEKIKEKRRQAGIKSGEARRKNKKSK